MRFRFDAAKRFRRYAMRTSAPPMRSGDQRAAKWTITADAASGASGIAGAAYACDAPSRVVRNSARRRRSATGGGTGSPTLSRCPVTRALCEGLTERDRRVFAEGAENDELGERLARGRVAHGADRDARSAVRGVAVDAGAYRRKRDRSK